MRIPARHPGLALLTALAVGSGTLLPLAAAGSALAASGTATTPAGGASAPANVATTPAGAATTPPGAGAAGGAAAPTTAPVPAGRTPTPPIGRTASGATATRAQSQGSDKISTGAIVAAAVAALLALGCAAWGIARLQAFEPHWSLSARHALGEAGFRASSTWDELRDWARLGR